MSNHNLVFILDFQNRRHAVSLNTTSYFTAQPTYKYAVGVSEYITLKVG